MNWGYDERKAVVLKLKPNWNSLVSVAKTSFNTQRMETPPSLSFLL
jgi:hypothetical protein